MRGMFGEDRIPSPCAERDALDAAIAGLTQQPTAVDAEMSPCVRELQIETERANANYDRAKALGMEADKLEGLLKCVAAVAHAGGAICMTEAIALTEVRRMTLQVWDRNGDPEHIRSLLNDNKKTYE